MRLDSGESTAVTLRLTGIAPPRMLVDRLGSSLGEMNTVIVLLKVNLQDLCPQEAFGREAAVEVEVR